MPKTATKTTTTRRKTKEHRTPENLSGGNASLSEASNASGETSSISGVATDSSQWRESKVRADAKISKTIAVAQYRLKPKDFEGLPFEKKRTVAAGRAVDMYLYNERDVERRAWERHGGPEAFDAYLAKLRERHIKKNGKSAYFAQPASSYEDSRDSAQYDHTIGSAALRRAKEEMAPWLWKAYNDALDRHKNDGWYGPEYYYSRPRDREGLIASALKLAKTYPPRPAQPLPSSPSVDALRAVLADAPRIADVEWGKEVPGLAFSTTWHPEYDEWYSWTSEILQPIFEALIGVIEAHGAGDDGWASARWEVYDRYAECLQTPISYDSYDKRWSDGASEWLEGRLSPELVNGSSRGCCEAGKRYNDMLPFSHPLGHFSVGRPQS